MTDIFPLELSPIDPEIEIFLSAQREGWKTYPPLSSLSMAEARKVAELLRAPFTRGGPTMASIITDSITTRHGAVRTRLYDPGVGDEAPLLIYLHGGGYCLFSIDTHDRLMREYAYRARVKVLGVDYALSPEAKFPIALDQIEDVVTAVFAKPADFGIDAGRIVIGGDSAGAALSTGSAIRRRDAGMAPGFRGLLLNYGGFQATCSDEAERINGGPGSIMDRAEVQFYIDQYTRSPLDALNPEINLVEADLAGLPHSFFVIAERDILSEHSFIMMGAMQKAHVAIDHRVYKGAPHSFLEAMSVSSLARKAIQDGADWLRTRIQN